MGSNPKKELMYPRTLISNFINTVCYNLINKDFNNCSLEISLLLTGFGFTPFLTNAPILNPLKTPEKQRFPGVFRWHKIGTFARNELMIEFLFQMMLKTSWLFKRNIWIFFHTPPNIWNMLLVS